MRHIALLKARIGQVGGLEKYALRIGRAFAARGDRVSLLTTAPVEEFSCYSTETCRWPAFRRMEQYDRFVQEWLKEHPTDIVFGMDRNRFQTHLRAGNGVHAAFLKSRLFTEGRLKQWTCRFNPLHQTILSMEKEAFEHPGLVKLFANSHMVRKEMLEFYKVDPSKIQVIHNGVEWEEMERDFHDWPDGRERLCQQRGLDSSKFHLLFVGNGYLRKGLKQLLKGLQLLGNSQIHLTVIGKENRLEEYIALTHKYQLERQVSFAGAVKEIRPFYQMADALAIPSFYDPFANVTVEALAMGLFVLSSKHNGGCEVLTKDNGLVIEDLLDPASIAEAIRQAMSQPKSQQSALKIRNSVQHLDFSSQLTMLMEACYG